MCSESVDSPTGVQKFQARDLPLKSVTVFTDRAELKRTFKVTLQEGLNDIVVENVATTIDVDSIRVDGTGTGVSIHEVQFKIDCVKLAEVDPQQVKAFNDQIRVLKDKCSKQENIKQVCQKRLASLNEIMENFTKFSLNCEHLTEPVTFNNATENSLDQFYSFHERKFIEANEEVRASDHELNVLRDEGKRVEQKIQELRGVSVTKKCIYIALEADVKETMVELELCYQVFNARWVPSYDIRVKTGESAEFKITYFGNINQMSGEDWKDTEVLLSTARPKSTSGSFPELPTLRAQLSKSTPGFGNFPTQMPMQKQSQCSRFGSLGTWQPEASTGNFSFGAAPVQQQGFVPPPAPPQPIRVEEAQVEKSVLSTTFTIPHRKSIPSDVSEHKVTIAVLELASSLRFDCVPSKNTSVFMSVSAINSSDYPLLAGTASIYVDNRFCSKVKLKTVACGEKFDCSLGVDSSMDVQYKPSHKFQQETGQISKWMSTVHEQIIVVKNTNADSIVLTIFENVPKSSSDQVVVKLHSPEVAEMTDESAGALDELKPPVLGAFINDSNNLRWTLLLNGHEVKELLVKWGVEYPLNETIEYKPDGNSQKSIFC